MAHVLGLEAFDFACQLWKNLEQTQSLSLRLGSSFAGGVDQVSSGLSLRFDCGFVQVYYASILINKQWSVGC